MKENAPQLIQVEDKEAQNTGEDISQKFFNARLKDFFIEISLLTKFTLHFFKEVFKPSYEIKELVRQSYLIGYKSLPLVVITGYIMGLVLTIQSQPTLAKMGAESLLPAMVGISIVREIGPMLTALICAGKVGSGIGAELASMKVTEQIDAMEVSGINPFKYIVVTRILATTLMVPLLVVFTDVIALYGSYTGINLQHEVNFQLFYLQVFNSLLFVDIIPAFIKTFFFGFAIGLIGCFKGYNSNCGTEGVGKAANSSVVIGSLLIFIIDMIAVQITNLTFQ
ncbi:MAG: ABC transporter permease [Bacteroidetes bacterium]|nr:ABC transporter permease [Bacteroidota bacterium]